MTGAGTVPFGLSLRELEHEIPAVCVAGELDLHTAPDLRDTMVRLIEEGHRRLIVDLSAVGFIDSTAIGVLLGRLKDLEARDGALAVACPEGAVMRTFRTAGVDRSFRIYATSADAAADTVGS